jgi:hypothetical protein
VLGPLNPEQELRLNDLVREGKIDPELRMLDQRIDSSAQACNPATWISFGAAINGVEIVASPEAFDADLEPFESIVRGALWGRPVLLTRFRNGRVVPLTLNRYKARWVQPVPNWSDLFACNRPEVMTEFAWITTDRFAGPEAVASPPALATHLATEFHEILRTGGDFDLLRSKAATLLLSAREAVGELPRDRNYEVFRNVLTSQALAMAREFAGLDHIRWLDIRLRKKRKILSEALADFDPQNTNLVIYGAGTHSQILLQVLKDYTFPTPDAILTTSKPPAPSLLGLPAYQAELFRPTHPKLIVLISSISYEDVMARNARRLFPDGCIVCFWRGRRTHLPKTEDSA